MSFINKWYRWLAEDAIVFLVWHCLDFFVRMNLKTGLELWPVVLCESHLRLSMETDTDRRSMFGFYIETPLSWRRLWSVMCRCCSNTHTHTHIYQFKCDNKWSASVFRCMLWKESIVMCERSLALSSTTIIIPSGLIINTQLLLCGIESVHLSQTLHSRGIFF